MSDEITHDKPLDRLAEVERRVNAEPEKTTAAARLRAFEDEIFGEDAVRIHGRIERGSGSPYQGARPEIRQRHAALEKLIGFDQLVADARAALAQAESDHAQAAAAANG